ncbi:chemotaxis protein CheA [bacterium]|nr:chemotaxis protein CheA [bacterium]
MSKTYAEFRDSFFEETEDHLTILNDNLIHLEKDKKSKSHVDAIFRVLHTLKSSAAAVGLNDLGIFTHTAEDLVQTVQNGTIMLDDVIMDVLFETHDTLQYYIGKAKQGQESDIDLRPMTNKILQITTEWAGMKEAGEEVLAPPSHSFTLQKKEKSIIKKERKTGSRCYALVFEISDEERIKSLRADLILNLLKKKTNVVARYPEDEVIRSNTFDGTFCVVVMSRVRQSELEETADVDLLRSLQITEIIDPEVPIEFRQTGEKVQEALYAPAAGEDGSELDQITVSQTIRIPVKRLDDLLHLVGELVILNSGLKTLEKTIATGGTTNDSHYELSLLTDNLAKISSHLQNSVMKARMIPIGPTFNNLRRVVRDVSRTENKDVDLVLSGSSTELDKNVIDSIGDPLRHMIRNAVDHGIETPALRSRQGKAARGTIVLSAAQLGNHVRISMKDDGQGIDLEKVKSTAAKLGLAPTSTLDLMDEDDILQYIFEPGFSTSGRVSSVSGRGVGLDVVKTAISALNGSVTVSTAPGEGTEFTIVLPLTLAITTVVVIESAGEKYAVPILDIQETIKIAYSEISTHDCVNVISHRDSLLPLIDLRETLNPGSRKTEPAGGHALMPVLVINVLEEHIGIIVDRILGKQDVMLKPLETHYRSVNGISGAAVMGDGSIVLVIDSLRLLRSAGSTPDIAEMEDDNPSH